MRDEDRIEMRRQRAFERLGTDHPHCATCGESDWRCIEAHHLAGRRRDAFTVNECANCHRKLSDAQKDHPAPNDASDRFLETVGHFLLGLADLCRLLVEKLSAFGAELITRAAASKATAEASNV